jgi:hypothetical protein
VLSVFGCLESFNVLIEEVGATLVVEALFKDVSISDNCKEVGATPELVSTHKLDPLVFVIKKYVFVDCTSA